MKLDTGYDIFFFVTQRSDKLMSRPLIFLFVVFSLGGRGVGILCIRPVLYDTRTK